MSYQFHGVFEQGRENANPQHAATADREECCRHTAQGSGKLSQTSHRTRKDVVMPMIFAISAIGSGSENGLVCSRWIVAQFRGGVQESWEGITRSAPWSRRARVAGRVMTSGPNATRWVRRCCRRISVSSRSVRLWCGFSTSTGRLCRIRRGGQELISPYRKFPEKTTHIPHVGLPLVMH